MRKPDPAKPREFSSQQEKALQAKHTVNSRIENARALEKQKALQREKDFLLKAEKDRQKQREKSEKDQTLKETFRRALARREQRNHTHEKDRDGR